MDNATATAQGATEAKVSIKEVLSMLDAGKTRKEVQSHYNLSAAQRNELFKHPQLKGRKIRKVVTGLEIVDDVTGTELENKFTGKVKKEASEPAAEGSGQPASEATASTNAATDNQAQASTGETW